MTLNMITLTLSQNYINFFQFRSQRIPMIRVKIELDSNLT